MTVTREKVLRLQAEAVKLPQIEPATVHYYAEGLYARVMNIDEGTLIVGKIHKKEHFFIVTKGRISVNMGEDLQELKAGDVVVSQPDSKRAIFALEDASFMTVHATRKKNLRKMEAELIEPEKAALFDAHNRRMLT